MPDAERGERATARRRLLKLWPRKERKEIKFMSKRKFSRGVKKFIRGEKARFRREVSDLAEREKLIEELYKQFNKE